MTKGGFGGNDRRFWADETEEAVATAPVANAQLEIEKLRSAVADLEETKARVRRDGERQLELQRGRVLEALLPVLDNLERSLTHAEADGQTGGLYEGVKLVHGQFLAALGQFGLVRQSAIGERFDPRRHEAVAIIPVDDPRQDGIVVAELEPAYVVGERIIRPARVEVGRSGRRPLS